MDKPKYFIDGDCQEATCDHRVHYNYYSDDSESDCCFDSYEFGDCTEYSLEDLRDWHDRVGEDIEFLECRQATIDVLKR